MENKSLEDHDTPNWRNAFVFVGQNCPSYHYCLGLGSRTVDGYCDKNCPGRKESLKEKLVKIFQKN